MTVPSKESTLSAATTLRLPVPARVVVLVSGSGTLLQALLDAAADPGYPVKVVAVGADRDGIEGLSRAERVGVPGFTVKLRDHVDRPAWDTALADAVEAHKPDLVVSAGFMKILGPDFLARFGGRMVNTHPALLPAFPGAHGVRDAVDYGVKVTGATVHLVDGGVDTGRSWPRRRSSSPMTTMSKACTSASRWWSGGCSSTWSPAWPARAAP